MAGKRKPQALGRSQITTEDGTVIITDPELGQSVSGRTQPPVFLGDERAVRAVVSDCGGAWADGREENDAEAG